MGKRHVDNVDLWLVDCQIGHLNDKPVEMDLMKRVLHIFIKARLTGFLEHDIVRNRTSLMEFSVELVKVIKKLSVLDKSVPEP